MSGTPEPQSGPSDSAPLRISYHRDHTLIKLQSTIIRLQLTIIFFPPPKNYTFFERIRFPFKIGTGQVDNTAGICPLLLKQECRKINAQRILVDNTPEACPPLSHKESRKIKGLWVLVDKWTLHKHPESFFISCPGSSAWRIWRNAPGAVCHSHHSAQSECRRSAKGRKPQNCR